jgi:hypothetical protein
VVLRKILEHKREWRRMHNVELRELLFTPNDQIKKSIMVVECGPYGGEERCIQAVIFLMPPFLQNI